MTARLTHFGPFHTQIWPFVGVGYTAKKYEIVRGIFFSLPIVVTTPKRPFLSCRSEIKKFSTRFFIWARHGLDIDLFTRKLIALRGVSSLRILWESFLPF